MSLATDTYNEDWLRTRTWDFYRQTKLVTTVPDLLWALRKSDVSLQEQKTALEHLTTLPAWQAAPKELVFAVAAFMDSTVTTRERRYSDDQPRDPDGEFAGGGGVARFTKTETMSRLRVLAAKAREIEGQAKNAIVEIGHREIPVVSKTPPYGTHTSEDPHDDLTDYDKLESASRNGEVQKEGSVVHLYVSSGKGYDTNLEGIVVGWLGTSTEPPMIMWSDRHGDTKPPAGAR